MSDVTVMFSLPSDDFEALTAKAKREGTVPGAILRAALGRDLKPRAARQPRDSDDLAFTSALRTLLARDIVESRDWAELERRLSARGYALRVEGGCLSLLARDTGDCLADATEVGASYGALMRRFGGPFPGARPADRASGL